MYVCMYVRNLHRAVLVRIHQYISRMIKDGEIRLLCIGHLLVLGLRRGAGERAYPALEVAKQSYLLCFVLQSTVAIVVYDSDMIRLVNSDYFAMQYKQTNFPNGRKICL
jgi:hypothetical protein